MSIEKQGNLCIIISRSIRSKPRYVQVYLYICRVSTCVCLYISPKQGAQYIFPNVYYTYISQIKLHKGMTHSSSSGGPGPGEGGGCSGGGMVRSPYNTGTCIQLYKCACVSSYECISFKEVKYTMRHNCLLLIYLYPYT